MPAVALAEMRSAVTFQRMEEVLSTIDFTTVTELAGDEVSRQQIDRVCHRYRWVSMFCRDKDVLEWPAVQARASVCWHGPLVVSGRIPTTATV